MNAIKSYIIEAVEELRHVRWPTRNQAIRLSIIVIGFTFVVSIVFGFIDFLLSEVVKALLTLTY